MSTQSPAIPPSFTASTTDWVSSEAVRYEPGRLMTRFSRCDWNIGSNYGSILHQTDAVITCTNLAHQPRICTQTSPGNVESRCPEGVCRSDRWMCSVGSGVGCRSDTSTLQSGRNPSSSARCSAQVDSVSELFSVHWQFKLRRKI